METDVKFIIKPYLKVELALIYHPTLTGQAAMAKMRRWINLKPELKKQMEETQISQLTHRYTSRQVAVLIEFLGEP